MKHLTISTVIPTFNRGHLLARAISSVLSQQADDDELIVVDDGSTDDTSKIVKQFGSSVRYILTKNEGAGAARNRGIKESTKDLVAFLDSDDEWMPNHNAILRTFMETRPDILFSFTNYIARFADSRERRFSLETQHGQALDWQQIIGPAQPASNFFSLPEGVEEFDCHEGDQLYLSALSNSYVCVNTMIVRRVQAGSAFRFAVGTPTAEEWECGARLARAGKSAYLHCETAYAYHHAGARLTDADSFQHATSRLAFIEEIWGQDSEFLAEHGELYHQQVQHEILLRVGGLLLRGRNTEARKELARLDSAPISYKLLASLPGPLSKRLLDLRRTIRSSGQK